MTIPKLKPCPHCGCEDCCASAVDGGNTKQERWWGHIFCRNCNMDGPDIGPEDTYEAWLKKATEVWNSLPRHLHFSKEKPTVEGMYWCRCIDSCGKIVGQADIMYFTPEGNTLGCKWIETYDEFAGPIPEPRDKSQCYDDGQRTD